MNVNFFTKFFLFCSGANMKVLKECQAEQNKYASIGFTIIMTSVLACLSGGFAFWTIFKSFDIAVLCGTFWGLMIGNLDRFLVSTTEKKENPSVREYGVLVLRVMIAVAIGFVIAKPLEVAIFEKPIQAELTEQNSRKAEETESRLNQKYFEIGQLENKNKGLQEKIDNAEQTKEAAYRAYIEEAEGTGGTRKIGKGPVFLDKFKKYEEELKNYENIQKKINPKIKDNDERIVKLTQKRDQELAKIVSDRDNADDIMTQLETLEDLGKKKPIYAWSSRLIVLIFILLDVSPILAKILMERGLYDILLEQEKNKQRETAQAYMELEQNLELQAITKVQEHPKYGNVLEQLISFYVSKISKEVSRIANKFDPSIFTQQIERNMSYKVQHEMGPELVDEEIKHRKIKGKADAFYEYSKDTMNGYVKSIEED